MAAPVFGIVTWDLEWSLRRYYTPESIYSILVLIKFPIIETKGLKLGKMPKFPQIFAQIFKKFLSQNCMKKILRYRSLKRFFVFFFTYAVGV